MISGGERAAIHTAIHTASAATAAVGGGLAQIPGSDNVPIVAIQTTMAVAIAKALGLPLSEASAKAAVGTALATLIGPSVARMGTQLLVGWIPGVGNAVNAATAAGLTEALGWFLADEFDKQR